MIIVLHFAFILLLQDLCFFYFAFNENWKVLLLSQVKAKKPSWKIGSPFSIKASNGLPKVQITDNMDLIDEDTLLTEDLKKPLRRILLVKAWIIKVFLFLFSGNYLSNIYASWSKLSLQVGTVKLEAQGKPARAVLRAEEEQKVENFGVNNITAGYSSVCVWQRMCYNVYKLWYLKTGVRFSLCV